MVVIQIFIPLANQPATALREPEKTYRKQSREGSLLIISLNRHILGFVQIVSLGFCPNSRSFVVIILHIHYYMR